MIRDTAFLLAPHASRVHSLMAASPPHVVLAVFAVLGTVFAVFLIWTVTTVNPRRSR